MKFQRHAVLGPSLTACPSNGLAPPDPSPTGYDPSPTVTAVCNGSLEAVGLPAGQSLMVPASIQWLKGQPQGWAGQGWAGQGWAGQGRAGQGRAGQGRAGQGSRPPASRGLEPIVRRFSGERPPVAPARQLREGFTPLEGSHGGPLAGLGAQCERDLGSAILLPSHTRWLCESY